jgi:hypothetical protein
VSFDHGSCTGLFLMGFSFQIVGTAHFISQAFALRWTSCMLSSPAFIHRRVVGLPTRVLVWSIFHSLSACLVWTFTIGYYLLEKVSIFFDWFFDTRAS